MATFFLTFVLLLLIVTGMSLGVLLMGKTIKGSCGGLNAISGADKCLVCSKPVDPDSPLREKLACKRACDKAEALRREIDAEIAADNAPRQPSE